MSTDIELPPLARGRPQGVLGEEDLRGATPARAGPTSRRTAYKLCDRSYPRSRGADTTAKRSNISRVELPPLARGRRALIHTPRSGSGATPARAGPTPATTAATAASRSYPRSRGADSGEAVMDEPTWELPPLARGRRHQHLGQHPAAGATPARAGPTLGRGDVERAEQSYPRSRGPGAATAGTRATPARAGPTTSLTTPRQTRRSYPRSRGADGWILGDLLQALELPPLARGRQRRPPARSADQGATPARAGPTGGQRRGVDVRGSYPRSRGADHVVLTNTPRRRELPPLARGRRVRDRARDLAGGATPARAGPTLPEQRLYCEKSRFGVGLSSATGRLARTIPVLRLGPW